MAPVFSSISLPIKKGNEMLQNLGHSPNKIMVVDDDPYLLTAIEQTLTLQGYHVDSFDKPFSALESLPSDSYLAVIADVKMPGMNGLEFLERIKEVNKDLPVILITGHGDVDMAVVAMKKGAYDFLEKPVDEDVLLVSLSRAVEKMQLILDNRLLTKRLELAREKRSSFHGLIGIHPLMQRLYDTIEIVAREDDPVLISGETGTGKELVAHAIHDLSKRKNDPFIVVNMGAIPKEILEAELFGYEKGAFTGAGQTKIGKFEFAGNGTIFLDEICSLPINLQSKLLRVLEDHTITRLGSNETIPVGARIISATNSDLVKKIETGHFRQDLYFRLYVLPIIVPSLKDRKSDIPLIFKHFCDQYCREHGLEDDLSDSATIKAITQKDWPGNVRELKNYAKRLCVYRGTLHEYLHMADNPATVTTGSVPSTSSLKQAVDDAEKKHIIEALRSHNGQINAVYKALMISRKCLYDKINKYEIDLNAFRNDKNPQS